MLSHIQHLNGCKRTRICPAAMNGLRIAKTGFSTPHLKLPGSQSSCIFNELIWFSTFYRTITRLRDEDWRCGIEQEAGE